MQVLVIGYDVWFRCKHLILRFERHFVQLTAPIGPRRAVFAERPAQPAAACAVMLCFWMTLYAAGMGVSELVHDPQARERLEARFAQLGDPRDGLSDALMLTDELRAYFADEVRAAFRELRACPASPHGVLVRGAGRDPTLPRTPWDAEMPVERATHVGEWILLTLASWLGTVVSYREQRAGQMLNNIVPVPGSEDEVSSQGSRSTLGLHRECTFSEVGPDFIGLYCHRGGEVATTVVSAARLQSHLTEQRWGVLREPRFVTPLPPAFCRGGQPSTPLLPHRVFLGDRENPEIRVDMTLTRGADSEAEEALEALRTIACDADVLERITLHPGDVLFLDNRKCLHGRESFAARFDGHDRWLVRLYVKADLWSCRDRLVGENLLVAAQ